MLIAAAFSISLGAIFGPVTDCAEVAHKAREMASAYENGVRIIDRRDYWATAIGGVLAQLHPTPPEAGVWAEYVCRVNGGPLAQSI